MRSTIFDKSKGRHVWPKRTICEVHREIYDYLVLGQYENILPCLEEAYVMGIKLCKKLTEHKCGLPEWKDNNSKEANELRQLRILMTEKLDEVSHNL